MSAGLDRETLQQLGLFLVKVIDCPTTDPAIRENAQRWFDELDRYLATHECGPVPPLSIIHICNGYNELVNEWLADIPPELIDAQPVRVTIIRTACEIVDDPTFSDNLRLDVWDAIVEIMDSLWRCAAEEFEVVE